jgi:transglutaminase-like putative cysteine protease
MKTFAPGKIIRPGFLAAALVSAVFFSLKADNAVTGVPEKVLKAASSTVTEKYPDADSVLLDDTEKTVVNSDGTFTATDESYEKILTEKGRRDKRLLSLEYNAPYDRVAIKKLEIIRADGEIIKLDAEANAKEMIDDRQMSSNIFDPNHKVLRLSIPGLEIGDIIHCVTSRVCHKPRMPGAFSSFDVFESESPIISYDFTIEIPDSFPLSKIKIRDPVKDSVVYSVKKEGGKTIHNWRVSNVPRIFDEPDMPPWWTCVQRLLTSTVPDWRDVSKWYWNLCAPKLDAVSQEMKKKTAELTAGITDERKKIEAVFYFVARNIRYMGITTEKEAPGYEPHDVCETFKNRHGVCRDKAALLVSMLRLAGVKAWPVLIYAGPKKDPDVPDPYFNHAIACAETADGGTILMDPTDENTKELLPAYLCDKSWLAAKPDGDTIKVSPVVPAEQNLVVISTRGAADASNTLKAETTIKFEGVNDGLYRGAFSKWKSEQIRDFFEAKLKQAVPGAKLTGLRVTPENLGSMSEPLEAVLNFEAPDYIVRSGRHALVPPPKLITCFGLVNWTLGKTGLKKRKYPLETEAACGARESYDINTGLAGEPVSVPSPESADTPAVSWKKSQTFSSGALKGNSEFLIKTVDISPSEYLGLKSVLKQMEQASRKAVVLRTQRPAPPAAAARGRAGEPDTVILSDEITIDISSKNAWKTVRAVKKKILTYAGKKRNSELKIPYNPVWEKITLTKASVTGPDGKVHELKKEELNLMDASWVAAAPRYPAGKILVASLPGVEAGSVIEHTVERELFNRPLLSVRALFASFDPVESMTVTMTYPAGMSPAIREPSAPFITRETSEKGEVKRAVWRAKDIEPLATEGNIPPLQSFVPCLTVSSGDWKNYTDPAARAITKAADSGSVRDIALKLTSGLKTPLEKIKALRDFAAVKIRPAGPAFGELPPDTVSPALTTLEQGYGDSADRAALLGALFKAAGFEPDYALASDWPAVSPLTELSAGQPQSDIFNCVLVRVKADGGDIWLNDTDQYAKPGSTAHEDRIGLPLGGGPLITVAPAPGCETRVTKVFDIKLDSQGSAIVSQTTSFFGQAFGAASKEYAEMTPENRRRHFQELTAALSQAAEPDGELATDFGSYPGTEKFTVKIENFAVSEKGLSHLALPGHDLLKSVVRAGPEKRVNPWFDSSVVNLAVSYKITLPPNADGVKLLPPDFDWEIPGRGASVKCSSKIIEGTAGAPKIIELTRSVRIPPMWLSPSGYDRLTELQSRLSSHAMKILLWEDKPQPPAKPDKPGEPAGLKI